jgi:hypothetical protein
MRKLSPLMRRAAGSEHLPEVNTWIDRELAGCQFKDVRLFQRFRKLLGQIASAVGQTIPFVCQDWANTKAAYRFFSNERVDEDAILSGHFQATRDRTAKIGGQVLILHDTTEFTYKRDKPHLVGFVGKAPTGKNRNKEKRENLYTVCGILMHSSLVVTVEGLPLGLSSIKFWTRKKFKGCDALKRKINPTRVPIEKKESVRWLENVKQSTTLLGESEKCVHICDREGDIYELFCTGQEIGTHFLIRTCVDRLAGSGDHTVAEEMSDARVRGLHRIEVRDKKGDVSEATLEIKYRRVRVLPPIGKQNRYPALSLTIIHAEERGNPEDREKIDWKLITDLPVRSTHDVIEKLDWYAMRWKIETFHKILKSGCRAEESKLRTAERLVNLISVFCILSWRVFWLTMMNRLTPDGSPKLALTDLEIELLDHFVKDSDKTAPAVKTLSRYLTKIAKLGGYLNRANDPAPGNVVMWRGLSRLTDLELGAIGGAEIVGN